MENTRPRLTEYRDSLKFKHDDFPKDEFWLMHPNLITNNCDVIILPFNQSPVTDLQVAIPVHKSLLAIIPYFKGQLNDTVEWKETKKSKNGFITLTTPEEVNAKSVFSYIKTLYSSNRSFITKNNCLDVFRLSKFWCDEFVATQAESFIKENIDKEIYKKIMKNVELQTLLEFVVDKFTDFIFTQVKDTSSCFDMFQIPKFDQLKCAKAESKFKNNDRTYQCTGEMQNVISINNFSKISHYNSF